MRKFILFLLFICLQFVAYAQVIKGTILERKTKQPILYATIYFNGTFVGTTADEDGNFKLDISKNMAMPLTISAIGYYSTTINIIGTANPFIIYLKPKLFELQEVNIKDKSLVRRRRANLRMFKNEFLGTTSNAKDCEILNEKDISFNYESDKDTLIAFASEPIQIINKALGYKITYYLDKFEYYIRSRTVFFYGNIIFQEDVENDESRKIYYDKKRKLTYLGSRMHFFRSLWSDNLTPNKFSIKNIHTKKLKYKDIVIRPNNYRKYIKYHKTIQINFNSKFSFIVFLKEKAYFSEDGYFDPSGIYWKGEMGNQRIADWLPYEYQIETKHQKNTNHLK